MARLHHPVFDEVELGESFSEEAVGSCVDFHVAFQQRCGYLDEALDEPTWKGLMPHSVPDGLPSFVGLPEIGLIEQVDSEQIGLTVVPMLR